MNDDRELLELAAKAAGLDLEWCEPWKCMAKNLGVIDGFDRDTCWQPLIDDGDALRLAVKLRISIMLAETTTDKPECSFFDGSNWSYVENDGSSEADAATRRAIVRAAAEIGKSMP